MIGVGELVLVIVAAIIFLGPEKLTEFARELGKLYAEYQKAKRKIELEVLYGYKSLTDEEILEDMKRKYRELEIEIERLTTSKSSVQESGESGEMAGIKSEKRRNETDEQTKTKEAKSREDPSHSVP